MEAVQSILENAVNFIYAALMAGPYTLLAIFDGPLQQLVQIKQIYQQIIQISWQLKPTPFFLPLFLDAYNILEMQMQNIVSRKYYPSSLQDIENVYDQNDSKMEANSIKLDLQNLKMFSLLPTAKPV